MKKCFLLCLVFFVFLVSGCAQVEHDISIAKDQSGKCITKIIFLDNLMLPQEEIKKQLEQRGVKNAVISPIKEEIENPDKTKTLLNGFLIETSWKTKEELQGFLRAFSSQAATTPLQETNDGTILVDFGVVEASTTKFHVEGSIIPESTQGTLKGNSDITFINGQRMSFQYKKSNTLLLAATLVIACVLVGIGFFYRKKNKVLFTISLLASISLVLFLASQIFLNTPSFKAPPAQPPMQEQSRKQTNEKTASETTKVEIASLSDADLVLSNIDPKNKLPETESILGPALNTTQFQFKEMNNATFKQSYFNGIIITSLVSNNKNNDSLWEIRLTSSKYPTARGIKVGQSASDIISMYGQPHKSHEYKDKQNRDCLVYSYNVNGSKRSSIWTLNFILEKASNKILEIEADAWSS